VHETDMTTLTMTRGIDSCYGELHVGGACVTHRYLPSNFWGGLRAWQRLVERGHALGMEIGHWLAPHLSPRAPIFEAHPEWRMIDALGFPAAGGYGFQTLVVGDWNSGLADWMLADLRRWHDEAGLDYLWVDSFSNMGLVQMNYAERMRTNYAAFARFLDRVQQIGIRELTFESTSALGCPSFGMTDLQGAHLAQRKDVAGQNDFGWWADEPDMICEMSIDLGGFTRAPAESARLQFQALASRGTIFYNQPAAEGGFVTREPGIPDWWRKNLEVFNRAEPLMRGARRLLPDRAGVVWHSEAGRCVWTFKEAKVPVRPGETVTAIHGKSGKPSAGAVTLPAEGVYRIG